MALQLDQLIVEEKSLDCPSLDDIVQGKRNSDQEAIN